MTNFSLDIKNTLLFGKRDQLLENCHNKFSSGDRSALMTAIMACALYQWTIPDWVADEILALDDNLQKLEFADLDEFFGYEPEHLAKLGKLKNIEKHEKKILDALFHHRLDGGNFTVGDGLTAVAEEQDVPRRIVEEVYKKHKDLLSKLPKNRNENLIIMNAKGSSLLEIARVIRKNNKN